MKASVALDKFGAPALVLASMVAVNPFGWDRFGPLRFALVSTIGLAVIAHRVTRRHYRRPQDWLLWGWGLVIGGTFVSMLLAADRWHALIGTPDRHFGWLTWILCAGLAITAVDYRELGLAWAIGAGFCGLWAIAELAGIEWFFADFASGRVGGPFGQPAILGAAMTLAVPVVVGYAWQAITGQWPATKTAGLLTASGLGLVALFAAQSRASWVGLVIALVVLMIVRRADLHQPNLRPVLAGAAVIGLVVLFATPVGSRLASLTSSDGVVAGRTAEWRVGTTALFSAPAAGIVGYGPENYRVVFSEHVDEQYVIDYGRTTITDRAHNGILDAALSGGIVAGLGMAILYGGVAMTAIGLMKTGGASQAGIGVGLLAYVTQQLFFFPVMDVDPAFWLMVGFSLPRHGLQEIPSPVGKSAGVFGFAMAVALFAGGLDVAADYRVQQAVTSENITDAVAKAQSARSIRGDSIRYDFITARLVQRQGSADSIRQAVTILEEALVVSRRDPALLLERVRLLGALAQHPDASRKDFDVADAAFAQRLQQDPNNPDLLQAYGKLLLRDDDRVEEANQLFQRARKLGS